MSGLFDKDGYALEDGVIDVYRTDDEGIYTGKEQAQLVVGTGLPANAYLDEPKVDLDEGFVIARQGDKWVLVEDLRGQTIYSTKDGQGMALQTLALPDGYTLTPPPTQFHIWDGKAWILDAEGTSKLEQHEAREKECTIESQIHEAAIQITLIRELGDDDAVSTRSAGPDRLTQWREYLRALHAARGLLLGGDHGVALPEPPM